MWKATDKKPFFVGNLDSFFIIPLAKSGRPPNHCEMVITMENVATISVAAHLVHVDVYDL